MEEAIASLPESPVGMQLRLVDPKVCVFYAGNSRVQPV